MTHCTTGKRIWPSRRAAMRHAGRAHSHRMRAYLCPECRGWHLANDDKALDAIPRACNTVYRRTRR